MNHIHILLKNTLLTALFMLFSFTSYANELDAKTEVANVYQAWCADIATAKGKPAVIVKFYAPDAILLPTLSPKILMNTNGGLNDYFTTFTQHQDIKCSTDKLITRVYGDMAINTGLYTFTYQENGKTNVVKARFSFIYKKNRNQWLILNHHSSKLPM